MVAAPTEGEEVGHGHQAERAAQERADPDGSQGSLQVPAAAHRQDGVLTGKRPVVLVEPGAERPEAFRTWKLLVPFLLPACGIVPDGNGRRAIRQVDDAAWIQLLSGG